MKRIVLNRIGHMTLGQTTIDQLLAWIDYIKTKCPSDKVNDIVLRVDWYMTNTLIADYPSEETDQQYQQRIDKENAFDCIEHHLYQKLKAKYEGNI